MYTRPLRRFASTLELLEARIAPAVVVGRTGAAPNFRVTFTDDSSGIVDNTLVLRFNTAAPNNLEYSLDFGATFSANLGGGNTASYANIATIEANLGVGVSDVLGFNLQQFAYTVETAPDANPLLTDVDLFASGVNHTVHTVITGAELLKVTGAGNDDLLDVNSGSSDSTARIQKSPTPFYDQAVVSDLIPRVEFTGLKTFGYGQNGSAANVVTFATANLVGATNFRTTLGQGDTFIVEGVEFDDNFAVTRPAAGQVRVMDLNSNIAVTEITSNGAARVEVHGLGGDDSVNVGVAAAIGNVIPNPIFVDGGNGTDLVSVSGAPATAVDEVIHQPGLAPGSGKLRYNDAAKALLMSVEYANVETTADLVPSAKLTINGTDAAEAITYTSSKTVIPGARVTIGSASVLELSNKTAVTINGLGGSDEITLDYTGAAVPPGLTALTIAGGDGRDSLIVHGSAAKNAITYFATASDTATIGGLQFAPITATGLESVSIRGGGGNDTLRINATGADNFIAYTPGDVVDAGQVRVDALLGLSFSELGAGGAVTIDGAASNDVLDYAGTQAADVFTVAAGTGAISLAQHDPSGAIVGGTTHIPVTPLGLERVQLRGLAGNDVLHAGNVTGLFALTFDGGADQTDPFTNGQTFGSATSFAVGKKPGAFAVGDVDGDQVADLVVANTGDGTISMLLGNGAGGFGASTTFPAGGKSPNGLVLRDFDADGDADLAVTIAGAKPLAIFQNDGAGHFGLPTLVAISGVAAPKLAALTSGELDGNAFPELIALNAGLKVVVFTNSGGAFTAKTPVTTGGKGSVDLVIADFNGDTKPDVAVANALTSNVSFLANDGTGKLGAAARFVTGVRPTALVAADFDGDGKLDLAVTHATSHYVAVLFGNGSAAGAQFKTRVKIATPGSKAPRDLVAADLDGDGRSDLIFANGGADSFSVLLGLPGGAFRRPIDTVFSDEKGQSPTALALADFNGDGLLDVALLVPGTGDVDIVLRVPL